MNREKTAWLVSIALVGLVALQIPGSLAARDDDYAFVRTLIDIHRQVLSHYADDVDAKKLREGAINGMLGQLDPHTIFIPPEHQAAFDQQMEGQYTGIGIHLEQRPDGPIEVVAPIDGTPAFRAGVLPGDIILKVEGESVEGMRLPDIQKKIAGKPGTEVRITFRQADGEEKELTIMREQIVVPTIKGYQRKDDNAWDYFVSEDPTIGYIRVTQFTRETRDAMYTTLRQLLNQGIEGLILDLRYNPGGHLEAAVQVSDLFLDQGVIVSTRGRNRPEQEIRARAPGTLPQFPMVVLVNGHSASASEIVAGALRDHKRALVVGERTFGKGSVQELVELDRKSGELKLTVAYYYLPSGRPVHRKKDATEWGVEPHIVVTMDQAQERAAMEARRQHELVRSPLPKPTEKQDEVVDVQLQRAVDGLIASIVFGKHDEAAPLPAPSPEPAQEEKEQEAPAEPLTAPEAPEPSAPEAEPVQEQIEQAPESQEAEPVAP